MSLADEARTIRERVADRLRELEPMVREYDELKRAAAELGIEADEVPAARPSPSPAGRSQNARPRAAKRRSAPRTEPAPADDGQTAQLLEAINREPGKSVSEYAVLLEVPPASLYRPVRQLTNDGAVVKRARKLFPR